MGFGAPQDGEAVPIAKIDSGPAARANPRPMPPARAITRLYRYPVKGLSAETLDHVALTPGEGLPADRRFAIAHATTRFDPAAPEWLPKTNFLQLMRNERLAKLATRFDPASGQLAIERDGKTVVNANIAEAAGRLVVESFFAAYMGAELRGQPRLVEAPGHMFSDVAARVVSLINLASVADLERITRAPVDPLRFRANLYFSGATPWEEFQWLGRTLAIGAVRLAVFKRIVRCAATTVNPATAQRDINVPGALMDGFGHADCGVYARVISGGRIAVGDPITLEG